jgi:glycine cleavage system T protein (aminomethyltransferase)
MTQRAINHEIRRTPLHRLHIELGGRFVTFAGYEMPIQYPTGILKEHVHTREQAGLFDVSHMGQILLRPRSGVLQDAARALETLVPQDLLGLPEGRQRYALFTGSAGGIIDDLIIANRGDHFQLTVNAACKHADEAHLRTALEATCIVEHRDDLGLLALQGPKAEAVLMRVSPGVAPMRLMDVREVSVLGVRCVVSRSGYTGEDGFEISMPAEHAETIARCLLEDEAVAPVGLGARDSLRLAAGLCLYGSDLDETTTPVEAALEWSIQKARRAGGIRAGGFPGADLILRQMERGPARRRIGLRCEQRVPVRGGSQMFASEADQTVIGRVTSGSFSPSLQSPIAMGYVATSAASIGERLYADVRGKRIPVRVCELPFVTLRYKRDR